MSEVIDRKVMQVNPSPKLEPQKPLMYMVTVKKVYPYQVIWGITIGSKLLSDLALIFSKTEKEIKKILKHAIRANQKVSLGLYSKEIAEAKEFQALGSFNLRVSNVEIFFNIEPILD